MFLASIVIEIERKLLTIPCSFLSINIFDRYFHFPTWQPFRFLFYLSFCQFPFSTPSAPTFHLMNINHSHPAQSSRRWKKIFINLIIKSKENENFVFVSHFRSFLSSSSVWNLYSFIYLSLLLTNRIFIFHFHFPHKKSVH